MKRLTKTFAAVTALTLSIGVFANMGGGNGQNGYQHPLMDINNPQYQVMKELMRNPEEMQAFMQSMRESPEARQEWMKQKHGEEFANRQGNFGCHGNRFGMNNNSD